MKISSKQKAEREREEGMMRVLEKWLNQPRPNA